MENIKTDDETKELIQKTVKDLIDKMEISCDVEVREIIKDEQRNWTCDIKTEESSYLIGQYGINLQALQHIARIMVRKKTENKTNFVLDVNFYRQEKNESISALAKEMAEKALLERRAIVLRPMSPYERRLIHLELSENAQIKTESTGEGEDRRVVIKPVDLI